MYMMKATLMRKGNGNMLLNPASIRDVTMDHSKAGLETGLPPEAATKRTICA